MSNPHNTLYVTTPGSYIAKDHLTVVVRVEKETRLSVPIHQLGAIVCLGPVGVSPDVMGLCAEAGVTISFLADNGKFLGRVEGPISGNVMLRRGQYRWADDPERANHIARSCVAGKIANSRTILQRAAREREDGESQDRLSAAVQHLSRSLASLERSPSVDFTRGVEGDASATYFGCMDDLIRSSHEAFRFEKRSRRPPLNRINALLSFGYALLLTEVAGALQGVGLDPAVGYLHTDRPGRLSLALDMMEEFRALWVDRWVLAAINRQQFVPNDFKVREGGGVEMVDHARKDFLIGYQKRKQESVTHPFTGEETTWAVVPHIQARLLARTMRGDLETYPPFLLK